MHRSRKSSKKNLRPIHTKVHTTTVYPTASSVVDPAGYIFIQPDDAERSRLLITHEDHGERIRPMILQCLKVKTDHLNFLRNGETARRHRTVKEARKEIDDSNNLKLELFAYFDGRRALTDEGEDWANAEEKDLLKKTAQTHTFFEATLMRIHEVEQEIAKVENERLMEKLK